ncbi:aspartate ammonia-lyase [Mesohalobacter halotolerans]|uniref:Aspartate ammonia-lyase n=1 Tax=Mesohalobacter halotolerans TaxID=1883405 RepID=A0A4U5TS43_9FLAO|nr:aspartate ammonia-lyase [Mesohalobacter halotolerans]MBS3738116.1 aspartate ammonia-lyase [Psychroflexus sp.]TKS57107.1 aspartate ammonia-lyase [Mesohalobacter halotolerans]
MKIHIIESSITTVILIAFLIFCNTTRSQTYRTETDLLGDMRISNEAYYGIQTARALENFNISGQKINNYPQFIKAWGMVKLAAAKANHQAGKMPRETLDMIIPACQELINGNFLNQFPVDIYQGGAGTSSNMNANEVIMNIALEKAGFEKGDYEKLSSTDDVNMSQSTNDTYPTAIKLAVLLHNDQLILQLDSIAQSFRTLGNKYLEVVKMGRTEMQDAVPMTVGQEFHSYATMIDMERKNLIRASDAVKELNMGATAIGTGINTPEGYHDYVIKHLKTITGFNLKNSDDLFAATSSMHGFVVYSSALKSLATTMSKISNDIILLSSGPRTGLFEINLPPRQPGSSIMPGKVNPVMPELMALVSYKVIGNDVTVSIGASDGDLQLNAYEPVIALSIFESQSILINTITSFRRFCIEGITVNDNVHKKNLESTVGIVTALNPVLGHKVGDELAKEALATGKGILELVREKELLTDEQIKELLAPVNMTGLDKTKYIKN